MPNARRNFDKNLPASDTLGLYNGKLLGSEYKRYIQRAKQEDISRASEIAALLPNAKKVVLKEKIPLRPICDLCGHQGRDVLWPDKKCMDEKTCMLRQEEWANEFG